MYYIYQTPFPIAVLKGGLGMRLESTESLIDVFQGDDLSPLAVISLCVGDTVPSSLYFSMEVKIGF